MARKTRIRVQVPTLKTVSFLLGKEECAIPITDGHPIIRDVAITKVPNVGPHVEGVLNLRGIVVPVVDLKHRLGLGVRALGPKHRILIVETSGRMVGLSVDAVEGVFEFEETRLQPPPEVVLARVSSRFVRGVVMRGETIVLLLDTQETLGVRNAAPVPEARSAVSGTRAF